jgi:apolipoprotein N-acyltransferase
MKQGIFFLTIGVAVLLILSFVVGAAWWVVFFALVPLFFFIKKCPSKKTAFWGGLITGFIFHGYLISYFFSSYPLDWAGIESRWGLLFIFLSWFVCTLTLALPFGFFGFGMKITLRNFGFLGVWTIPALWVICEYLKSWSLAIVGIGPGSVFGPHWSIGHLGYSLANNLKLLQLAGWGGIYLLSFLVVVINALIFGIIADWQKENSRKPVFLKIGALILILIAAFVLGEWELNRKSKFSENNPRIIKAALIQTDFPSAFREDFSSLHLRLEALLSLMEKIKDKQERFDIVVMNERHHFIKLLSRIQSQIDVQKFFADFPAAVFADIKPGITGSEQSSLLFFLEPRTQRIIGEQEKIMLLPGGEYMPYLIRLFALLTGETDWLEDFLSIRGYEKGGRLNVVDFEFGKFGGLLCSEILSPVLYRSLTNQGAELLINVASDSVFRGNPILLSQNLAMAKVRAVESNRYFLQATNAGYSYIIDNRGIIKSAGKEKGNEVIFGEAELISQKSFYAKTGDWIKLFLTKAP